MKTAGESTVSSSKRKKTLAVKDVSHPKSRKARKMYKEVAKKAAREKSKQNTFIKQNALGEKMIWFRDRLPSEVSACSKESIDALIQRYLGRFDEELEQIRMKHRIGHRKGRQHASRENAILFTKDLEKKEYESSGLEIPNLLDPLQFKMLKEWNGELRFIQNFTLYRFGKKDVENITTEG